MKKQTYRRGTHYHTRGIDLRPVRSRRGRTRPYLRLPVYSVFNEKFLDEGIDEMCRINQKLEVGGYRACSPSGGNGTSGLVCNMLNAIMARNTLTGQTCHSQKNTTKPRWTCSYRNFRSKPWRPTWRLKTGYPRLTTVLPLRSDCSNLHWFTTDTLCRNFASHDKRIHLPRPPVKR